MAQNVLRQGSTDAVNSRCDYDIDGNVLYVGEALPRVDVDTKAWSIWKYFYDSDDNFSHTLHAVDSWTNRTGATYQ